MKLKRLIFAIAAVICCPATALAERSGAEPATNSKRDVLNWAERELDLTGWYYVNHSMDASLFMSRPYRAASARFMVKLRAERFRIADTGEMSLVSDVEVDCKTHRTRLLGTIAFAMRNLRKPVVFVRKNADEWRSPENTSMDDVFNAICLAPVKPQ
jgi:hypothetical protein